MIDRVDLLRIALQDMVVNLAAAAEAYRVHCKRDKYYAARVNNFNHAVERGCIALDRYHDLTEPKQIKQNLDTGNAGGIGDATDGVEPKQGIGDNSSGTQIRPD